MSTVSYNADYYTYYLQIEGGVIYGRDDCEIHRGDDNPPVVVDANGPTCSCLFMRREGLPPIPDGYMVESVNSFERYGPTSARLNLYVKYLVDVDGSDMIFPNVAIDRETGEKRFFRCLTNQANQANHWIIQFAD